MNMSALQTGFTPEDLLALEDGQSFELIDGQLVQKKVGAKSSRVAQIINCHLDNHATAHKLGLVFPPDCGYQIFADDPRRVRKPDGSFIRSGRLPDDVPPDGHVQIAPDLVLEVVSPHDLADEIAVRVLDYLQAGVRLVWVIYPKLRFVHVFRPGGSASWLTQTDTLSGEDVLPGFSCPVADLFEGI